MKAELNSLCLVSIMKETNFYDILFIIFLNYSNKTKATFVLFNFLKYLMP